MLNRSIANLLSRAITDPAKLDRLYNNRALVPEFASHLARWQRESATARATIKSFLDMPYGNCPNESLNIFIPSMRVKNASVMVFIHGGYWRSLDKSDHSFVAPPFVAQGAVVVVSDYALCPEVSVLDIALQSANALAWVASNIKKFCGNPDRITVVGHSAGGHLAAMLLSCNWKQLGADLPSRLVHKAVSISGLFDLAPLKNTPFCRAACN
jgi:arylformamidase